MIGLMVMGSKPLFLRAKSIVSMVGSPFSIPNTISCKTGRKPLISRLRFSGLSFSSHSLHSPQQRVMNVDRQNFDTSLKASFAIERLYREFYRIESCVFILKKSSEGEELPTGRMNLAVGIFSPFVLSSDQSKSVGSGSNMPPVKNHRNRRGNRSTTCKPHIHRKHGCLWGIHLDALIRQELRHTPSRGAPPKPPLLGWEYSQGRASGITTHAAARVLPGPL